MVIIRKAAAAGRFYPRFKGELLSTIKESFLNKDFGIGHELQIGSDPISVPRKVLGAVCPHAGYIYSGSAASFSIQEIYRENAPDTIFILGTSHTGYYQTGVMKEGLWNTPLGNISIDSELADYIITNSEFIREDDAAFNGFPHGREHCIEVQIPFIQYASNLAKKETKIVPIKIGNMNFAALEDTGRVIAHAIKKYSDKNIAIIASSDMTHYEPRHPNNPKSEISEIQYKRDKAVIEAFEQNNWEQTFAAATHTTVCGPQTISTLMIVGKELGYLHPTALKYYTSFEKMHKDTPCSYSVGYFSGIIK
ncbi:MAG: AmmeMemoRadiSam system protein B [Promethearchaeota archaeon]